MYCLQSRRPKAFRPAQIQFRSRKFRVRDLWCKFLLGITPLPLQSLRVLLDVHGVRLEDVQRLPPERGADALPSTSDDPHPVPAGEIPKDLLVESQHLFRVREDVQHVPYGIFFCQAHAAGKRR